MARGLSTLRGLVAALALIALLGALAGCGREAGDEGDATEADTQTVMFQEPTAEGPDPFTEPADVRGETEIELPAGTFGGTGSDYVCDRELLIRSLRRDPGLLRAWADVLELPPTSAGIARYIRSLTPVTLVVDTRVTNHSFRNGRAAPFQSILQAGTAVLVDERGIPRARCRCGNPLLEPVFIKTAKCTGCPPNYKPPEPCHGDDCWEEYPDPPRVRRKSRGMVPRPQPPEAAPAQEPPPEAPPPPEEPVENPAASISPAVGNRLATFVLNVSGYRPDRTLDVAITRPSGALDSFSISVGPDGFGTLSFPPDESRELGTYSITVTDPETGARASTSVTVTG